MMAMADLALVTDAGALVSVLAERLAEPPPAASDELLAGGASPPPAASPAAAEGGRS
jgi:hypothetical protein